MPATPLKTPALIDPAVVRADELLVENGWASAAQVARAREALGSRADDPRALARLLAEQHVLAPEALSKLDALLRQQERLPGFRLQRQLGAGGMGTVYLAVHRQTGQQCALKVINHRLAGDGDFLSRFHRETTVLIGLRHPHLANVIDSGTSDGTHFLAMEYIHGPSLASLLRDHRALPQAYVLRMVRQVAECLSYVYAKAGLVHRDIKPENILVQRSGPTEGPPDDGDQAKLIDFGLVKAANDEEHLTQTGMTIGTPLYMSPEQVRGERLDCRSDIYGLGATAYHLLTGSPPFKGTSPGAIMSAHLTDPVPDPKALVPGLAEGTRLLIRTALAKDIEARFATFEALIRACDELLEELAQGGTGPRLLRKPLVMRDRTPRRAEDGGGKPDAPAQALPELPTQLPPPESSDLTTRIANRHRERKQAQQAAEAEAPASEPAPPAPPAKVPTTSHRRKTEPPGPPLALPLPLPPAASPLRSKVFDEDPARQVGMGYGPWAALIVALAVLAAVLLLKLIF